MLRSAFTAFVRSFTRHPQYALLNLLGLSFGIAAFVALSLFYLFETSFESWSPERPHIYEMGELVRFPGSTDWVNLATHGGMLDEMKAAWPQVDGTRESDRTVTLTRGTEVLSEQIGSVDGNFLSFFRTPVLRGNAATALADPSHIVVSAAIARKYFDTIDVLGRNLTLKEDAGPQDTDTSAKTYTISAVMADLPKNSDMRLDILRRLPPSSAIMGWDNWRIMRVQTYLKFQTPADAARIVAQLPAFTDRQAAALGPPGTAPHKTIELQLLPLAELHLRAPKLKAAVISLGLVGILALALALINYVNLATARAGLRAREVAVRKTLGAPPPALRWQFLIEAMFTLLLAFLVGLSAVELTLPLINAAGGLSLSLDYRADAGWIAELLGCVLAAGLAVALYPAVVLSGFKPAQVLASSRTPAGGRRAGWLRTGLAMLQFAAVVVAFILMAGFMLQIRHIQTSNLGFERDNLLVVDGLGDFGRVTPAQREAFVDAARALPAVHSVSFSDAEPGPNSAWSTAKIVRPGHTDSDLKAPGLSVSVVGPDYFRTLGTRPLAGRLFDPKRAEDEMPPQPAGPDPAPSPPPTPSTVTNAIISRGAVRELGFATPQAAIGQTAVASGPVLSGSVRIIGVVEDVRFSSPEDPIQSKIYLFNAHPQYAIGLVRYRGVTAPVMRQTLARVWQQINSGVPLDAASVSEKLDPYYKPQRDRSHLFDIGTGIAALIGCIGLYGMAAFNASRRVREVGMRKVLGASRGQMVALLLRQFLWPVALAGLIAWPVGWIVLKHWLSQFDDVIAMPFWVFPAASMAALLIALLTVAGIAFTAAGTEPGKALRYE